MQNKTFRFLAVLVIVISIVIQLYGVFLMLTGSSEMFPTDEQQSKIYITATLLVISPLVIELFVMYLWRRKYSRAPGITIIVVVLVVVVGIGIYYFYKPQDMSTQNGKPEQKSRISAALLVNVQSNGPMATLIFKNDGTENEAIDNTEMPADGHLFNDIFDIRNEAGERIIFAPDHAISEVNKKINYDKYGTLEPQQTLSTEVNLRYYYAFSKGKHSYTMKYSAIHKTPWGFKDEETGALVDGLKEVTIESNTSQFTFENTQ